MNQKGFAISGMLYSILVLFLIMILSILATLGTRKLILDKTKKDVYNNIQIEANKELLAAYKIINKNSGTANFAADNKNTSINANLGFSSKYYFKGANPNNYLKFAGQCWRIISISQNNTIKLIYENTSCSPTTTSGRTVNAYKWNENNNNNWYDNSTVLRTLLENYSNSGNLSAFTISSTNLNKIADAVWYVGALSYDSSKTLADNINQERTGKGATSLPELADLDVTEYTWQNKFGLINTTEFVKASSNPNCYNAYTSFASTNCKNDNYLYKDYNWWTLNARSDNANGIFFARLNSATNGDFNVGNANQQLSIRPVIYLKSDVIISNGTGTASDPYIIS